LADGRQKLPNRRRCETLEVPVAIDGSKDHKLLITVGYRSTSDRQPSEVFCSSFRAGTAMNAIVMDACVLLSRLLQHGVPADEVANSLSSPPSLVGAIAKAVASASA
jgi:hypothetical protein